MLVELRRDKNNNIADYLAIYKEKADQILHKKIKSLQESRDIKIQLLLQL